MLNKWYNCLWLTDLTGLFLHSFALFSSFLSLRGSSWDGNDLRLMEVLLHSHSVYAPQWNFCVLSHSLTHFQACCLTDSNLVLCKYWQYLCWVHITLILDLFLSLTGETPVPIPPERRRCTIWPGQYSTVWISWVLDALWCGYGRFCNWCSDSQQSTQNYSLLRLMVDFCWK